MFARKRTRRVLLGAAAVAASALVLAGCSASTGDADPDATSGTSTEGTSGGNAAADLTLKLGSLLPQTGALAFLGPPMEGGSGLAVKEINDAATGLTIDLTAADEGDTDNKAYETSITKLRSAGITAMIGAAASGVTKLVLDGNVSAGILEVSASNTSPDFTDWKDDGLFFRTAPSDLLQGEVLGNLIAEDGHSSLAIIYQNDAYGTGLNAAIADNFTASGGEVVEQQAFNVGDATYQTQVGAIAAAKPDAIAIVSFDQFKTLAPLLVNAGLPASSFYLVDGNLSQYGSEISVPLDGAKGTKAGPKLADDFTERLNAYWTGEGNAAIKDYTYAAEAYDAVVLVALAALAAQSTEGKAMAGKMAEVSGGSGDGEKCTSFEDCATIIADGGVADYDGYSGDVTFDENGDPQGAAIGIYEYVKPGNEYERID